MSLKSLNRNGKTEIATVVMWIVVIGLVAYVFNFGGFKGTFDGLLGGDNNGEGSILTDTALCPTDGTTTYTINVQDELSSTATDVDVEFFIFNGDKLVKEGSISGTGTVDVACGRDYNMLLVNVTPEQGAYGKVFELEARVSEDTINALLTRYGQARIIAIENPDLALRNSFAAIVADETQNFDLKFSANLTARGFNNPIILCESPTSNFTDVSIGSFSDGTDVIELTSTPRRLSATSGTVFYAFEYRKLLTPAMGVIVARGTLTAGSVAPSNSTVALSCRLIDSARWQIASYKTAVSISDAFPIGAENTENLNDVGGPDSATSSFTVETGANA